MGGHVVCAIKTGWLTGPEDCRQYIHYSSAASWLGRVAALSPFTACCAAPDALCMHPLPCVAGHQHCGGHDAQHDGAGAGPARASSACHAQHASPGCAAAAFEWRFLSGHALPVLDCLRLLCTLCQRPTCSGTCPSTSPRNLPPPSRVFSPAVLPTVQCGATAYALGRNATERDAELVDLLFSSVGFCIQGGAAGR